MDAIVLLQKDHRSLRALFKKVDKTTERSYKMREKLFKQIKKSLKLHTKLEEKYLYPLLKEFKLTRALAFEAFEEHDEVDYMLKQISKCDANSEVWTARFTVLKENISHHIREEEKSLFPKVKKIIPKDDLKLMGELMEEYKSGYS